MSIEYLKKKGVTYWLSLIKTAYYCQKVTGNSWYQSYRDRHIDDFAKRGFTKEQVKEFFDWITTDDGQVWFTQKSPSNAASVAIRNRFRFCPAAEKFIVEKAKDRGSLLEYCMTFGIVLQNMEKVTLKAAFSDDADYEQRYIKHIEENKKKVKEFLAQLVSINQVDPNKTVKELLDTL